MMIFRIYMVCTCLTFISCIDNIGVFSESRTTLIVTGQITNSTGPFEIQLKLSKEFNTPTDYTEVNDAQLTIEDDLERVYNLEFLSDGKYETPEHFSSEIGRSYRLLITLESGREYISSFEKMEEPVTINNLYYTLEELQVLSEDDVVIMQDHVSIWVDYTDDGTRNNFYKWGYSENYEVMAPYAPTLDVAGDSVINSGYEVGDAPLMYCWIDGYENEFLNISSDLLYNGLARRHNVADFVYQKKFDLDYSIEVYQYQISNAQHSYWQAIETQIENNGTIFETSNYQIRGNITSVYSPTELVLGYFSVASQSSSRIFILEGEVPYEHTYACDPDPLERAAWCDDCRLISSSSTIRRPSFWDDNMVSQ